MASKNQPVCPLFPDTPCPQGTDAADACDLRLNSGFDPMADFKDFDFMQCAVYRAREEEKDKRMKAE